MILGGKMELKLWDYIGNILLLLNFGVGTQRWKGPHPSRIIWNNTGSIKNYPTEARIVSSLKNYCVKMISSWEIISAGLE